MPALTIVALALLIAVIALRRYHPAFATFPQVAGATSSPEIFEGGSGAIDSSSPDRAARAIAALTPRLREELQARGLELGAPIFIRIFKESYELELWVESPAGSFERFRTYRVAALSGVLGPKKREGDYQSPEGFYHVSAGRFHPQSRYHLSFDIGYPNEFDRALGRTGSLIMIHGKEVSIGCYAMTDASIEEIYTLGHHALERGQPFFRVHIFPFRMTPERLQAAVDSEHLSFWRNLQEGDARFESTGVPPGVWVEDGRYTFTNVAPKLLIEPTQ